MQRITENIVVAIADHAKTFTGGEIRMMAVGGDIGFGTRYVNGTDHKLWQGRGASSGAAAYYIGAMLGWAQASGTEIPDDVRELCERAQGAYAKAARAEYWEQQGRNDATSRYSMMRSRDARRVESSSDKPYEGADWATHHVSVWLVNDSDYIETARTFTDNLDALRGYVADLLYTPKRVFTSKPPTADQRHTLKNVRESFTRADFDAIDWERVRSELIAE